eukprot:Tbor_TRINITY_DN5218_c0_g1::TRINITY_DN5218_c0_g1_i1::g.16790::m.16790
MSDWKDIEDPIAQRRINKCNETLVQLLGGSKDKQPKVGLCLSGGGWRAMTSAVALMDALSTTLDPSVTISHSSDVKLMDTVGYAFGLSGGSWALMTTLIGQDRNPFHTKASPERAITEDDRRNHPWLYGKGHSFDPSIHKYEGLEAIVSKEVVRRACYSKGSRDRIIGITSKATDTTIAGALVAHDLGSTLVERWSNFIANDILHFLDEIPAESESIHTIPVDVGLNCGINSPNEEEDDKGKNNSKKQTLHPWEMTKDPNAANKSRHVKMSSLTRIIEDGSFPFVVCSAIANHEEGAPRLYNWVEICPYYLRNHLSGIFSTDVDNATAYFAPSDKKEGRDPVSLRAHHFMGICGSAFACDVGAVLPASASKTLSKHFNIGNDPIIGKGLSEVTLVDGKDFGMCRDAGIDINIPLPPMLPEQLRSFDVIIVMDAGSSSKNAFELWKAVDLGYLQLLPNSTDPLENFDKVEKVRVFRGVKGYPSIIYFLGLVDRPTSQIIYKKRELIEDIEKTRNDAMKQLIPMIITELRIAKANLDGQHIQNMPVGVPSTTCVSAMPVNPFCSLQSNVDDDYDTDDDSDFQTDETPEDESTAVHATGLSCYHRPNSNTWGSGFASVAQNLVLNAVASNLIHETIDSFQFVEESIFKAMPLNRRIEAIHAIETTAVYMLIGSLETTQIQVKLANYQDLIYLMLEMGILVKSSVKDSGKLLISEAWADYYSAIALSEHMIPETDKFTKKEALIHIGRHNTLSSCTKEQLNYVLLSHYSRPSSRFCRMLGSIIHKIHRKSGGVVDCSEVAVGFISKRVRDHLTIGEEQYSCDIKSNMDRMAITGTSKYDVLEETMLTMGFHVADFFSEALSFNADQRLTDQDCKLLVEFSRLLDALAANDAMSPVMTGTTQALLVLESFSRHHCANTTAVLTYMFRPPGSSHTTKKPTDTENKDEGGFLYKVHNNPNLMQHPEDLLRVLAACYSTGRKKHAIIKLFKDRTGLEIDRKMALENSFSNVLRYFVLKECRNPKEPVHLDDHSAVDAILSCSTNYATVHNHLNRSEAIRVLWRFSCANQEYRISIAEKCLKSDYFWPFLSSYGRRVNITSDASFVKIERILIYSEIAAKKNIRVRIDVDDKSILTELQKERVTRVNSKALDIALTVKDVAMSKATVAVDFGKGAISALGARVDLGKEAAGAAGGFLTSFLSKKKK